jgi:hypothetical protein
MFKIINNFIIRLVKAALVALKVCMINELYQLTWYDIVMKKENDEKNFST